MLLNSLVSSLLGLPKPAEPAPSTPPQDSQSGQSAATSAQADSPQDAETTTSVVPPAVSPPSRPTSESIVVALSEDVSTTNASDVPNSPSDSPSDSGPSRAAAGAYAVNEAGGAASASVLAAGQSSQSATWIMPEVALDENAARAAAEAYRAEARQTSILEGLAATPDVVDLGQQESSPTNATAAANPYGQMAVAESGSSNAFVPATPLNKVA